MINDKIKKVLIYTGAVIGIIVIWGLNSAYFLFIMLGFGLGFLLHNWLKGIYDDTVQSFFTTELRKRQMKKKELEQELEKYKEEV